MPNFGPVIGEGGQANNDQNSPDGKPPYSNATPGISELPFSNIDFGAYGRPNEGISTVPQSLGADTNASDDENEISTPLGNFDLSNGKIVTPWGNVNAPLLTEYVGQATDRVKKYVGDKSETTKAISDLADLVKSHVQDKKDLTPTQVEPSKSTDPSQLVCTNQPAACSSQPQVPQSEKIGIKTNTYALQTMFSKSTAIQSLLGKNFTGKIDGNIGSQTNSFANEIEHRLAEILGSNKVFGHVLSTTPEDVEQAINLALSYKNQPTNKSAMFDFQGIQRNRSDRIYEMSKILIKSHKV